MWKNMVLYFHVAAGLVAGEWQPQDYGQHQMRYAPVPPLDQRPITLPVFTGQPASMPQARPCRRRNNEDPVAFTDNGWVPIPIQFAQPPVVQTGKQTFQTQLKPQALTENNAPVIDDRKETAEPTDRKPDKNLELVDKSPLLNQISGKRYTEENEYKKATPNQKRNDHVMDSVKADKDSTLPKTGPSMVDKRDHTSTDRVGSHEESLECGRNEEVDPESRDNSEIQDLHSKNAPNKVHDQAVKLPSNCIHENRRSMSDFEGDSRKFESDIPPLSDSDKTDAEASSKTGPLDKTQRSLLKSVPMASKNAVDNNGPKHFLHNPAKNAGKYSDRQVSLLQNGKVCYACSSYHDPSCWSINATTTVKYCNKDNNACLTKMYKIDGKSIVIRDCGHTCNEDDSYNIGQKMTSCSMCHSDMCNSAYAMQGLNVLIVAFSVFTLKFTLQ